jgi:hypothetical protein
MALIAHFLGNRRMDVIVKHPRGVGAMGIMAGGAACLGHRIVHMLLDEGGLIRFMALQTEGGGIIYQEMISLGRGMRVMAAYTPLLYGIMPVFQFGESLAHTLMATEAQDIAIFYQIKLVIRSMGVMAFYTAAFPDDFMDAERLRRYHRFMAFMTDFIGILRQKFAVG